MTGLFSSFDLLPFISLSLLMVVFVGIFFIKPFWVKLNRAEYLLVKVADGFAGTLAGSWLKGSLIIFVSLFSSILWFNWLGMFSYIFTNTGMISMTLSSSSFIWLSLIIMTLSSNLGSFLAHLVPNGTPLFLVSFMVFIELISNVIRPLTLGVRLAANITAGHLLMALLASLDSWTVSVSLQIMLFALEIAVGLIQAYVFALLSFLYFTEA